MNIVIMFSEAKDSHTIILLLYSCNETSFAGTKTVVVQMEAHTTFNVAAETKSQTEVKIRCEINYGEMFQLYTPITFRNHETMYHAICY